MATDYASYQQNQQIETAANNRATQAYNAAKLRGEAEDRALTAARDAWTKTKEEAGLTGMYQGQFTMPTQQWQAETFGTWGAPTAGEQTLAGNQQQFGQGTTLANMYGQYYAPGTAPTAGQQTQAAQQQAFAQGLQTQQEQRAAQQQQQSQAQQYLSLLAGLRGPADWAKYQQVLGSTPGGMRDLYAAAMGQYVPGGGATTGMQPQAVSLQSLMGDVSGNPYTGQGGGSLNMPNVYGQNSQGMYQQQPQAGRFQSPQYGGAMPQRGAVSPGAVPQQAYMQGGDAIGGQLQNVQWQTGQPYAATIRNMMTPPQQNVAAFTPGGGGGGYQTPATRPAASQGAPVQQMYAGGGVEPGGNNQQYNAMGNGTNTMGAPQQNQMNLPAPNQIAAQSWNNMAPSQQQMLLGQYESQGWDKGDVQSLMNQALPKYGSNAASAGTWRLR